MNLEQQLTETFHSADDYAPSADLFAKVERSIEEDRASRGRLRRTLLWLVAAAAAVIAFLLATVRLEGGQVEMSFASLELLVTTVMVGIVTVMGPAIRRFGQTYERNVFAANPETGAQVLALLDIAYYLVFSAYILMTLMFEPPADLIPGDRQFADALLFETQRVAGLFLLMGLLHITLVLALPIVGLVHSATLRRARIAEGAASSDEAAAKIDRGVTVGVWAMAAYALVQVVGVVLAVLLVLGAGG